MDQACRTDGTHWQVEQKWIQPSFPLINGVNCDQGDGLAEEDGAFDDAESEIDADSHNQGHWDEIGILDLHVHKEVVKKYAGISIFVWIDQLSQEAK